jgi:hypothetical protein
MTNYENHKAEPLTLVTVAQLPFLENSFQKHLFGPL